jgi:hypothetical protein
MIRLVYTNAGIFVEFWRENGRYPNVTSTYLIDLEKASELNTRYYSKFGTPQSFVTPSGNMYISYIIT